MKKPPKVGERVFYYDGFGNRWCGPIEYVTPEGICSIKGIGSLIHYRALQGRLIPTKPKAKVTFQCKWSEASVIYPIGIDGRGIRAALIPFVGRETVVTIEEV
jgi:hypothetical protein